jgi:hypothetical protein
MGKSKNYDVVDCGSCIWLTVVHFDLVNKEFDCILRVENVKGKKLRRKHKKKLLRAVTRYRKTGKTEFCRFFQEFQTWKKLGKKGNEFIKGRYSESTS